MLFEFSKRTVVCSFLIALPLSMPLQSGAAAEKNPTGVAAAKEFVSEALMHEIYGEAKERERLLRKALKEVPHYAPAMWQLGYVKMNNQWVPAADVSQHLDNDRRYPAYELHRAKVKNTVSDQLQLANWCRDKKLFGQERAHLSQVIELATNHDEARRRMGFVRVGSRWELSQGIEETAAQRRENQQNLSQWRGQVEKINRQLSSDKPAKREQALTEFQALLDPAAIPAMEAIVGSSSADGGLLFNQNLAKIDDGAATLCLIRQAVNSDWPEVRRDSAKKLGERDLMSFVPLMLAEMRGNIRDSFQIASTASNQITVRRVSNQERQNETQTIVRDTNYQRVKRPTGNAGETRRAAMQEIQRTIEVGGALARNTNSQNQARNERIAGALQIATEQELPPTPQAWWQWWNDYNEILVTGKSDNVDYSSSQVSVVDRMDLESLFARPGTSSSRPTRLSRPRRSHECLTAGTPVWTARGHVAIEKMKAGDLVLSQDVVTGELTYKSVLRTTIRPTTDTVRITVVGDSVKATLGHPFWVSGEGWVKAKDLESGMELHTHNGVVAITEVAPSGSAEAYNLVVDEYNNYFVGKWGLLNHDNSARQAAETLVPGLE